MKKLITCLIIFISYFLIAQKNLLPNGDFEIISRCPNSHTKYLNVDTNDIFLPFWYFINRSTPDFFHRCAKGTNVSVPCNFAGCSEPKSGDGFVGIILRVDTASYQYNKGYVEHISTEIAISLKKNSYYALSFSYKSAPNSGIITNGLGVYLSSSLPDFNEYNEYIFYKPQIFLHDSIIIDNQEWMDFVGFFIASGDEKYITIGNFVPYNLQNTKIIRKNKSINEMDYYAYCFIDNVKLYELKNPNDLIINTICTQTDSFLEVSLITKTNIWKKLDVLPLNQPFALDNVYFTFDSYELSANSLIYLDSIVDFLKTYQEIEFVINGHTDNIGSDFYNKWLSTERAKAVYKYFFNKGISPARMQYVGYGDKKPISTNKTNEGRQKNRRVEIVLIKK